MRKCAFFLFLVVAVFLIVPFFVPYINSIHCSENLPSIVGENPPNAGRRDLNPPEIEVNPNAIEDELNTGESSDHVLVISNIGDDAISFVIEHEYINQPEHDANINRGTRSLHCDNPLRDDLGEVLFQLDLNMTRIVGFDWDPDEQVMWTSSASPRSVQSYTYDGEGGVENIFFQEVEEAVHGIGFLDGIVYTNHYPTSIVHRYNQEGEAIGDLEIDCERILDYGTSKQDGWLFALSGISRNVHVYDVENDYQNVGIIDGERLIALMEDGTARSMCWVDDHPDGQLWLGSEFQVWQFSVDTENWQAELAQEFDTQCDRAFLALGHDGENIWRSVSVIDQLVNVYDDGIDEFRWITYDPDGGNIEADEDLDIIVGLDATGLFEGEYEGVIHFISDDPDNPDLELNVRMNVIEAPVLDVEWSEEAGFPDNIDWNNVYLDIYSGEDYPISVMIINSGSSILTVEEIGCENDFFTCDPPEFEVPAQDSRLVNFILNGDADGEHDGTMFITSNDAGGDWEVLVQGTTTSPPILLIEPGEIEIGLIEGERDEQVLNITNPGAVELRWSSKVEYADEHLRDSEIRSMRKVRLDKNGPRRDPLEDGFMDGLRFACFTTDRNERMPWLDLGMIQDPLLNEENFVSFRNQDALNEIDFEEFDALIFNLWEQRFVGEYNANIERLLDYIDGGGGAYFETGIPGGLMTPGGISNNLNNQSINGRLIVSPNPNDENFSYLAEILHTSEPDFWLEGEIIEGSNFLISGYSHDQFEEGEANGTIDWFQPIIGMENRPNIWGAVAYGIGSGTILTIGHSSGDCWTNWAGDGGQWGSIAAELLYFLSQSNDKWLSCEPEEGEVEPDGDQDLIVIFDSGGLLGGIYEAELCFFSNDPVAPEREPDVIIPIIMEVTGEGRIFADPGGHEDDDPFNFGIVFIEYPETAEITITNVGTGILRVEEAICDNELFVIDEDIEFPFDLEVDEETAVNVTFNPIDQEENQEATILFITEPPHRDWEDGYPVRLTGLGLDPPNIIVEPDMIVDNLENGAMEEYALNLSNVGGSILIWDAEFEIQEHPEFDNPARSVRHVNDSFGPERDDAGDILAQFDSGSIYCGGMTSTHDGLVWGCAYQANLIIAMNTENGEIVNSWAGPGNPLSMTWTGEEIWVVDWMEPNVIRYDLEGNVFGQVNLNFNLIKGMGCDLESYVFLNSREDELLHVIELESNDEVATIDFHAAMDNADIWGIEWVRDHPDGQLWGNAENHLYQVSVDDEWNVRSVQDFESPGDRAFGGPAHDGKDLWVGGWANSTWFKIDDGITELRIVTIEPTFGEIEVENDVDVIAAVSTDDLIDGFYTGNIYFNSNDPETPRAEVEISIFVGILPEPEHFTLPFEIEDAPEAQHLLRVEQFIYEDEIPSAGWEIGVFTEADDLGGSVLWAEDVPVDFFAYGAEDDFEGFENGEIFNFLVWDNEADEEFEVETTFIDGPEIWREGGETTIELIGGVIKNLVLELREGWNMISINVAPRHFYANDEDRGPDVLLMFDQLEDEDDNQTVLILKDINGRFWLPQWDFNNIVYWDLTQGYKMDVREAVDVVIPGWRISADADITISLSWNMIAYLPEYDLDASAPDFYVLSPIIDNVVLVKDWLGRFISTEMRFSNMLPWTEGQGYHIKTNLEEPVTFNYPPEQEEVAFIDNQEHSETVINPVVTSHNMSVLINSITGIELSSGDRISAYSSSNDKIGSGEFTDGRCGLAVWGDEENTEAIEGALKDEEITLRFWDASEKVSRNLNLLDVLGGNGLVYKSDGFLSLDVEVQSDVPENYYLSQNYPNPFNSTTRLTYGSPENSDIYLSVFDMNGKLIKELVKGTVVAGNFTVNWDATDVSAGVYLVQMKASTGFERVVQVILIK